MDRIEIADAIWKERERQDAKWGFPQSNNFAEWATIISEEFGELAKSLNEAHFRTVDKENLIEEAIHVAAVAMSIIEHYEVAVGTYKGAREEREYYKKKAIDGMDSCEICGKHLHPKSEYCGYCGWMTSIAIRNYKDVPDPGAIILTSKRGCINCQQDHTTRSSCAINCLNHGGTYPMWKAKVVK